MTVWQLVASFVSPTTHTRKLLRSREVYASQELALQSSEKFESQVRYHEDLYDYSPVDVEVWPLDVIEKL